MCIYLNSKTWEIFGNVLPCHFTSRCEDCIMSSACLTQVVSDTRETLKHSGTLLFVSVCLLQGGEIIDKLQTLVSKQRLFSDKQLSV